MGWVALVLLTAFALLDALGLALETRPRSRAELGIATSLFFASLVGGPVLGLGYAGLLWPASLAGTSLAVLAATFAVLARRRGARELFASCRKAAVDLARLPVDAVRASWEARSLVLPGLV